MNKTNNDFKGIWIPFQILTDKNLSDKEKFLLCLIAYKSKFTKECSLSNKYLSSIFNVSETQISKLISSLAKKKYIDIKLMYENDSKEIKVRIIKPKNFIMSYMDLGIKQKLNTSSTNVNEPIQQKCKDNKRYYKNNKYSSSKNYTCMEYSAEFLESLYEN